MPRLSKVGAAALAAFGWTGLSSVTASYLVIAGGGAGGGIPSGGASGGGGGAGGLLSGTTSLNTTLSYTVTVGAGGAFAGTQGSNSVFSTITSTGGGTGGTGVQNGGAGGSGGGSCGQASGAGSGTVGQGNNGGVGSGFGYTGGGGGGGAGAVGGNADGSTLGGSGGNGSASSISGTSVTYAGGGGGGTNNSTTQQAGGTGGGGIGGSTSSVIGGNGTANLGAGGGGGGSSSSAVGGQGGSGVVIISYVGAQQFGGGIVTSSGGNTIHTFTTSGTLSPLSSLTASYLIVAGGAGGGGTESNFNGAGGGGAGGLLSGSGVTIDTNSTYLVTVGAGGTGGTISTIGVNGSNSNFSMVSTTAVGGGGGGTSATTSGNRAGANGGSGGGGCGDSPGGIAGGTGTSGQGNAGGSGFFGGSYGGGGGGGASAVGQSASATSGNGGGNGGAGTASSISGSSVTYAGGGAGGMFSTAGTGNPGTGGAGGGGNGGTRGGGNGFAGTTNLGGGGGGATTTSGSNQVGGNGGSGIVIISYAGATQLMAGGTVTVSGGNVIHTFTSSGFLTPIVLTTNSLRFRSSVSAYLNRTFASAGNQKTWTWSAWVKIGSLSTGTSQNLFGVIDLSVTNRQNYLTFQTDNTLAFYNYTTSGYNYQLITTQVFRDPSAWYHIVCVSDTTQATSSNRLKMYVNGTQITAFGTASYPSQNFDGWISGNTGSSVELGIGRVVPYNTSEYFDGYMADINFIDGQALTPFSFGTTSDLGVWQPIRYGGSYGTNGFYLPFNSGTSSFAGSFNGSSQYLNLTANSSLQFGTGDFTVEGWYYQNGTVSFGNIFSTTLLYTTTGGLRLSTGNSNNTFQVATGGSSLFNASVAFSASRWNHFAIVRSSGVTTLYQNGVSVGSASDSNSYTANTFVIGWVDGSGPSAYLLNGLLSNFRVVKGTAVYTSNFIPSTSPLTAITNTSLLTLQNSTIIDNSTNAFSITNNGTVTTGQTYPCSTAIFNDQGPQGNNWTPNNISGITGSTLDYMTDVPTLTSATAANYCTLNTVSPLATGTISNANLTFTSGGNDAICVGTFGVLSGKWYWEVTATTVNASLSGIGIIGQPPASLTVDLRTPSNGYCYISNGNKGNNNTTSAYGATYTSGDVIGIALDMDAGTLVFYKNNSSQGTAYSSLTGTFTPALSDLSGASSGAVFDCNFGQRPFAYTPPSGFVALNTFNLPTPTIGATASSQADNYFNAVTYTGTSGTQAVTGVGFQPDFVWIKNRTSTLSHVLQDAVRGTTAYLVSNATTAENTNTANDWFRSFNSDGFTVATLTTGSVSTNEWNNTGYNYVSWNWRASNTTAVTNTAGSITSTVSANTTAGFSIVTYTGIGSSGSVGHGLGAVPTVILIKARSSATAWRMYQANLGITKYLVLNTTAAEATASMWGSPTTTTFIIGGTTYEVNETGVTYVAYCFAPIAGYSAFGSYTGNGSSDGTFIFTGFRPRYILIKSTGVQDWIVWDTARDTYNASQNFLLPNSSAAESGGIPIDFVSNGIKIRTANATLNSSGVTYIYMAFAENPFKYANAR